MGPPREGGWSSPRWWRAAARSYPYARADARRGVRTAGRVAKPCDPSPRPSAARRPRARDIDLAAAQRAAADLLDSARRRPDGREPARHAAPDGAACTPSCSRRRRSRRRRSPTTAATTSSSWRPASRSTRCASTTCCRSSASRTSATCPASGSSASPSSRAWSTTSPASLQVQERLTTQIAGWLDEQLAPEGRRRRARGRAPVHVAARRPEAGRAHRDLGAPRPRARRPAHAPGVPVPDPALMSLLASVASHGDRPGRRAPPSAYPRGEVRHAAASRRQDLGDDSQAWLRALRGSPAVRDAALVQLHELLMRGARHELARRRAVTRRLVPRRDRRPRHAGGGRRARRDPREARHVPRREPLHHLGVQVRAARGRREGAPARLARA